MAFRYLLSLVKISIIVVPGSRHKFCLFVFAYKIRLCLKFQKESSHSYLYLFIVYNLFVIESLLVSSSIVKRLIDIGTRLFPVLQPITTIKYQLYPSLDRRLHCTHTIEVTHSEVSEIQAPCREMF